MGVRVPRITLKADYGEEKSFGELNLLSIGYGFRQAWIYAAMFGTSEVFGIQSVYGGFPGHSVSLTFFVSIVIFGLCLIFAAITDQKFLKFYVSRQALIAGAILTCVGTLVLLMPIPGADLGVALEIASGVLTGIGTALLILFWGTAFARCDGASIVVNTALAIVIGVGIYAIIIQHLPFPVGALVTAALPLGELIILLKKTPEPFNKRKEIPIFNPLPVHHGQFFIKFGIPVFIFGIALGILRHTSIQAIAPAVTAGEQMLMLLASGCATILMLVTILALGGAGQWNRLFRPLIPFIAVAVFFLPLYESGNFTFASFILLIAYMSFEALMWIFFGELSQRFRLSPVFVFGMGRGLLALAAMLGSFLPVLGEQWTEALPFGESGVTLIVLLVMVIAYALLPREREIEAIVAPCPLVTAVSNKAIEDLPASHGVHESTTEKKDGIESTEEPQNKRPLSVDRSMELSSKDQVSPHQESESETQEKETSRKSWFKLKVEAIANTYLLSNRETEVLFFLAKGHNSAYIQEKLYISEGTAKTHIRHIYRKLNVHNQQELMRMVESATISED